MPNYDKVFYKSMEKLSPKDDLGKDNVYVSTLRHVWKDKNVKNIAIVGPYGSGKSSIVRSFINSLCIRKKRTLYFSQEALFEHYQSNKKEKSLSSVIYEELLKHDSNGIVYKKIIDGFYGFSVLGFIINILFIIFNLGLSIFSSFIIYTYLITNLWISIVAGISIFFLFAYIHSSYLLKSIKTKSKNFELDLEKRANANAQAHPTYEQNALINQIKKNKIRFIVIEDLERLKDNTNIVGSEDDKKKIIKDCLVEFKILCDLISRSKIIKKKVCFIYGLNEGCFDKTEDRSKYFDFILPVLPRVGRGNAYLTLKNNSYLKVLEISNKLITHVSVFIENERIANALISEFKIHSKVQNQDLDLNKIFAMSALNVISPSIYKSLYEEDNVLNLLYKNRVIKPSEVEALLDKAFVESKINNENVKKFLLMCINQKYIDRGYKSYLSIGSMTELTENDNEFYKKVLARYFCFDDHVDEPEKLIEFDSSNELVAIPNKYIMSALITNKDYDKRKSLIDAFPSYNIDDITGFYRYLIDDLDFDNFSKVFEYLGLYDFVYPKFIETLNSSHSNDLANKSAFVLHFRMSRYPNSYAVCDPLVPYVNNIEDFSEILKKCPDFVNVLSNNKKICFSKIDKLINESNTEIFKKFNIYIVNNKNLTLLYSEYATNPLKFLSSHSEIVLRIKSFVNIFDNKKIEFSDSNIDYIGKILETLNDESKEVNFLNNNEFNDFKTAIDVENTLNKFKKVLVLSNIASCNEYSFGLFSDNKSRLEYLHNNIDFLKRRKNTLTKSWSEFAINNLSDDDFNKLKNIISVESNNINESNKERYYSVYSETGNKKLLQVISDFDFGFIINKFENSELSYAKLKELTLSIDSLKCIFDNHHENLYHLGLEEQNVEKFNTFIIANGASFYSDKIFVGNEGKVISCDNEKILKWFILKPEHSFETKSYIAAETSEENLKKDFWIEFLKSFGKMLPNKNMHFENNENNKRILVSLYRAEAVLNYKEKINYLSCKLK